VLQEREIERIGGTGPITVDVRIIATTNRDLEAEAKAGRFRQDLFYRLSVFPIRVPALRERRDDIPLLAHRFAARAAAEATMEISGFPPDALDCELQHAVERAVILSADPLLHAGLFTQLRGMSAAAEAACAPLETGGFVLSVSSLDLLEVEQRVIGRALDIAEGNRTRAAGLLGINVRTLRRKLNGTDSSNGNGAH
jgi:DNA-binding NtrC family response regulator